MARCVMTSRVSASLTRVGRGQRVGVAAPSAATIPTRTSGGGLAYAATRRVRSASGGAWSLPTFERDSGGTGPPAGPPVRPRPASRSTRSAARAALGAARSWGSAHSPRDFASARGFNSPPRCRRTARSHGGRRTHRAEGVCAEDVAVRGDWPPRRLLQQGFDNLSFRESPSTHANPHLCWRPCCPSSLAARSAQESGRRPLQRSIRGSGAPSPLSEWTRPRVGAQACSEALPPWKSPRIGSNAI
jgi:hypothetical protein